MSLKDSLIQAARQALNDGWNYHVWPPCADFVSSMMERAGYEIEFDNPYWVPDICASGVKTKEPVPGDLVVFWKSYDANRDGQIDDKDDMTHIGIKEDEDHFIHYSSSGLRRDRFNDSYWSDKIQFYLTFPEYNGEWITAKYFSHDGKNKLVFSPTFQMEIGSIEALIKLREVKPND